MGLYAETREIMQNVVPISVLVQQLFLAETVLTSGQSVCEIVYGSFLRVYNPGTHFLLYEWWPSNFITGWLAFRKCARLCLGYCIYNTALFLKQTGRLQLCSSTAVIMILCDRTVCSLGSASSHQLRAQSGGGSAPAQCIQGLGGVRCWSGADGRKTAAMDFTPRDSNLRCL